jgi:hypothetical protein
MKVVRKSELSVALGIDKHQFYRLETAGIIPIGDMGLGCKPAYSQKLVNKIKKDIKDYNANLHEGRILEKQEKVKEKEKKSNAYRVPVGFHSKKELVEKYGLQYNSLRQYEYAGKIILTDTKFGRRGLYSETAFQKICEQLKILGYKQIV